MALLAGPLPSPYETITFYYGIYSSSYRGKEKKERRGKETPMEMDKIKGKAKASASWARLIHKIFEVDSLLISQLWQSNENHRFYYQPSGNQKNL